MAVEGWGEDRKEIRQVRDDVGRLRGRVQLLEAGTGGRRPTPPAAQKPGDYDDEGDPY